METRHTQHSLDPQPRARGWIPKWRLEDLALWGAPPAFSEPLHVGRPNIPDRKAFFRRVEDILDRRWLTNNGPYVQEFERRVGEYLGVRHCIAVCNATVGLEVAARALGLSGEVILPSFTFVASAHALRWVGITPVFCDVRPGAYTLDPGKVEELITPRTTGILGVHVYGNPCDVRDLEAIASRHGLHLYFDAAHAFGASHAGKKVGGFGEAEVFSFHATKMLGTFEGGAVTTNRDDVARRLRLARGFGLDESDEVVGLGTNAKMSEVCAAMGLTGLESIEDWLAIDRRNYEAYREGLADIPGITLLPFDGNELRNYQYVVVEVDRDVAGLSRDDLVTALGAENVLARRYFYPPCHQMEPYRASASGSAPALPVTEAVSARVAALPTGTAMGVSEVRQVCQLIRLCVQHGRQVGTRVLGRGRGRAIGMVEASAGFPRETKGHRIG
jgi:dTDP-4-amino-4,6-dideoxygalactose transaminase